MGCLGTEFELLQLLHVAFSMYRWICLILYFLLSPKTFRSEHLEFIRIVNAACVIGGNSTEARTNNRINKVV
jgi:hypothetical protein